MSSSTSSAAPPKEATGSAQGMFLVLLAAMLWGTTGTAQSFAPANLSPYWVGALRLVIASVFFVLLYALLPRPANGQGALHKPRLLLCALCMALYNLAFFAGLQRIGVGFGTAVALGSSPVWAGLLQALLQRRWPSAAWWLGTCIGVIGGFVMGMGKPGEWQLSLTGIALCLLAGLTYGAYAVISQPLVRSAGVPRVNAWVFGGAAVLSLPIAMGMTNQLPTMDTTTWAVVLYLGVIATGVSYLLFSNGLRTVSAATSVALSKFEPITAFTLSILVVGEAPSWMSAGGLGLVLLGLWLVVRSEMRGSRQV